MSDPPVSIGYAFGRLERAARTASTHTDPATRARAVDRMTRWQRVIDGMATGALQIGTRAPTAWPSWVTLEVVHGGFATGAARASGPLRGHERALLDTLEAPADDAARLRLNRWFVSDGGQRQLLAALHDHRLHIELPEEGALVVVAWLLEHGETGDALALLDTIEPFFDRLRFYPHIGATPHHPGSLVHRCTVGEVQATLRARRTPDDVLAMNEAMAVWTPLRDRLVALWGQTVDGDPPMLADGRVAGGWPCRRWPADWTARRAAWLRDYGIASRLHHRCGAHRHPRSNFSRLRTALERCPEDSQALSGRDVGWIRRALANTHTRRGVPGSDRRIGLRAAHAAHARRPTYRELARILAARLEPWPVDSGLPTLDGLDDDVRSGEDPTIPAGSPMPQVLADRVALAYEAPLAELVERGIIGSAELLATFVPQIIARVRSGGFGDPAVRALYEALYTAFRRRRSVLLVDLSAQIRPEEVPWFAALQQRRDDADLGQRAGEVLRELTLLYLTRFPATPTPNPLIREFAGLAHNAGLELPLCAEIAADIFTGHFTDTWVAAARLTAETMRGTLYARYYDLPRRPPKDFAAWCRRRAREVGLEPGQRVDWLTDSGAILEQSQIVTSHNLAALVHTLGLDETVRPLAGELATRALTAALDRLDSLSGDAWEQRRAIRSAANAWRQGVFFLSLAAADEARKIADAFDARRWKDAARWAPVVRGLRHALEGKSFDGRGFGVDAPDARRLLGWWAGRHWLMPAAPKTRQP